jgi:hypothetical protein
MLVLTILLSENERILSLKPDVDGRSSSKYAEFTGSGIPIAPGGSPAAAHPIDRSRSADDVLD